MRVAKLPAVWIIAVFLVLVAAEIGYYVARGELIPASVTGSVLYPVGLAALGYVLVFSGSDHYRNLKALLTAGCFGLAVSTVFLLSKRPKLFDALSAEDGLVEYVSAGALLVGAIVFVVLSIGLFRRHALPAAITSAVFAVVLFVIGMEEISWMQRILGFESGDFLAEKNLQGEFNLHNINTGASEKLFYFGGFLSLIVVPYFQAPLTAFFTRIGQQQLGALVPPRWVLLPSSIMVGYVGTSVTKDPTAAIAVIVTALVLFKLAMASLDDRDLPRFLVHGAFLVLVVAMAYYFTTYNYQSVGIRSWARKEYLELIIALGLMGYAFAALRQSMALGGPRGELAE